jgi:ABC-type amino acid transport substrate-binding protein
LPEDKSNLPPSGDESAESGVVIAAIYGNSSVPPAATTNGRIFDALVLEGQGLANITVSLDGVGQAPNYADLAIRDATPSRVTVALPPELKEGTYDLRARADDGEATARVTFFRGEAGKAAPNVLVDYYTRDEFEGLLFSPEGYLDSGTATQTYAAKRLLLDLSLFEPESSTLDYATTDQMEGKYAKWSDQPGLDPSGYPTRAEAASTYASPSDLPDIQGAVQKGALPDWSQYTLTTTAEAEGVPKGTLAETYLSASQAESLFVSRDGPFGAAQQAEILALIGATPTSFGVGCPAGMVSLGKSCADTYEARVVSGTCDAPTYTFGQNGDDYPAELPDQGGSASGVDLAVCTVGSGRPSGYITWFQALTLCRSAGKRLCTNAEWQLAALGTPDAIDGPCTLNSVESKTASPGCASQRGVVDAVGNLAEWTADWMAGGPGSEFGVTTGLAAWSAALSEHGSAHYWNTSALVTDAAGELEWRAGLPTAVVRGGSFASGTGGGAYALNATYSPLTATQELGFRCCTDQ